MRAPLAAMAGGVVVALAGAAGLVRASMPVEAATHATTGAAPIVVTDAYVRPSLPPTTSTAAYFTIRNTTAQADVLQSVASGAGASAMVHMTEADGSMQMVSSLRIPAHGVVTLSPGKGHVMIDGVYGRLLVGQTVNLDLQFAHAGDVEVVAPVVAYGSTGGSK